LVASNYSVNHLYSKQAKRLQFKVTNISVFD
jgi:hypothetical protein